MATNPQEFAAWMTPFAEQASQATGLDVSVILAQWGNETAYGTEFAQKNNIGNVGVYSGGSNPSFGTLAEGVQAYINEMNSPAMAKAKAQWQGQTPDQQAQIIGSSGYAGGGYNNGSGPGSSLIEGMQTIGNTGGAVAAQPTDWSGLQKAVAEGGGAYLSNLNATNTAQGANPASGASAVGAPGDQSSNGSAYSQLLSTFNEYFTPSQADQLAGWAWGELAGGKNSDQIMVDLLQQPVYQQSIYGQVNTARAANGLSQMTPDDIQTYQDSVMQYAQSAGLPKGFVDNDTIVSLMGSDVSATEVDQRLTAGYAAAMAAPQETKNLLSQYYGVNTGDLAAYYLDPTKAQSLLEQQMVGAEVGTQAAASGFGALTASDATWLAQNLAAQGKVGATSGKWDVDVGSQFSALAPLASLESAMPGMGNAAPAISQKALLDYGFLNKGQQTVNQAIETRKAFAGGGGGEDVASTGVVGAGSATTEGVKNQLQGE